MAASVGHVDIETFCVQAISGLYLLAVVEDHGLGNVVDGQPQSCPPRNHNGKDSRPNGQKGDDDKEWGGDGANNVGPDSRAVHDAHEWGQAANH